MTTKASIYKVHGTLAALVTESVWDSLLAGMHVGVWEEDNSKYSLIRNGLHKETISANDDAHAILKLSRMNPEFETFCLSLCSTERPCRDFIHWEVKRGYPVVLHLPAETVERMKRANLDSAKVSQRMRELASKIYKGMSIEAAAEEIMTMGSAREGKA